MIVLQINLNEIAKRKMELTAHFEAGHFALFSNLNLIGEELWLCHANGITVYDCHWNKLNEIRLGRLATCVVALGTKTVVIGTDSGLLVSSTSGMSV